MAGPQRDEPARRIPTALVLVVLATIIAVVVVFFVASAANETADDGGDQIDEPVTDPDIEVPVEQGVPGEGDEEEGE